MPAARSVSLTIPAKGDYVLLARLALGAVCRLTALRPDEVADLKLAVTEAAAEVVGEDPTAEVRFEIDLEDDRLLLDIAGPGGGQSEEEAELGRAIVAATVDEHTAEPGRVRLVKFLGGEHG